MTEYIYRCNMCERSSTIVRLDERCPFCDLNVITDWERINHLANCGFSIWQIIDNGVESWRCQYKIDEQHEGKTLREAMDKAIIAYRNEQGISNETDSNCHNNIGRLD